MRVASLLLGLGLVTAAGAQAKPNAPSQNVRQIVGGGQIAEVNLDLHIQPAILVRFPVPAGTDPNQAAGELAERYNEILVDNQSLNRFIQPADVVVYAPAPPVPKTLRLTRHGHPRAAAVAAKPAAYTIYVLGRKLLSVDAATSAASGGASPRSLAIRWAHQLQVSLPQLCWRPPSQSDPPAISDPALLIATDLTQVGGDDGDVYFRGHKAFTLHGVQPGGKTAADEAEALSHRLAVLANRDDGTTPPDQLIQVQPDAVSGGATLCLGQSSLVTVTPADARACGQASAQALVAGWAAALRKAWPTPAPVSPSSAQ